MILSIYLVSILVNKDEVTEFIVFIQVACGISQKLNPQIDEIDLPDVNDQLAVVEYVRDLYAFYKQQQVFFCNL